MPMLLHLALMPGRYAVCRLAPEEPIPAWALVADAPLWSLTRTRGELSVVVEESGVPPSVEQVEPGWRALALHGPIPFGTTGVIAALTAPLAAAHVPVFVISTFDTDVVLVKADQLGQAVAALRGAGMRVEATE
jgi:hypothetical protein